MLGTTIHECAGDHASLPEGTRGWSDDQCLESAIRDACDFGYQVNEVTGACLTYSQEWHDKSLRAIKGYCRQRTTDQVIAELG